MSKVKFVVKDPKEGRTVEWWLKESVTVPGEILLGCEGESILRVLPNVGIDLFLNRRVIPGVPLDKDGRIKIKR